MKPHSFFHFSIILQLYCTMIHLFPLYCADFSILSKKKNPPCVPAAQTDEGMLTPLGLLCGHYMSNMPDRRGEVEQLFFFCLARLILSMFGERKWVLCAEGMSLSSPLLHRPRGRLRDELKIELGAQVSFQPTVRYWENRRGKGKQNTIWCKMKWRVFLGRVCVWRDKYERSQFANEVLKWWRF